MQAIVRLDGAEISTEDPWVCRTLVRLIASAVSERDQRVLAGGRDLTPPEDRP